MTDEPRPETAWCGYDECRQVRGIVSAEMILGYTFDTKSRQQRDGIEAKVVMACGHRTNIVTTRERFLRMKRMPGVKRIEQEGRVR